MKRENYDYLAHSTGDLTDYLSEMFDNDLEWMEGHLNGLPLYHLMKALEPLIIGSTNKIFYIGNNNFIDEFILSQSIFDAIHLYKIIIDDDDDCYYYITKIK